MVVITLPFFYAHTPVTQLPTDKVEHTPVPNTPDTWSIKPLTSFQQETVNMSPTKGVENVGWVVEILHPPKLMQQVMDLVHTLRENGFQAYMEGNSKARILIGPVLKRDRADVISTRLYEDFNLKSTVVPFEPLTSLTEIKE